MLVLRLRDFMNQVGRCFVWCQLTELSTEGLTDTTSFLIHEICYIKFMGNSDLLVNETLTFHALHIFPCNFHDIFIAIYEIYFHRFKYINLKFHTRFIKFHGQ